jgi:peptidoglycan-N-acetylglucosamine deacetylase
MAERKLSLRRRLAERLLRPFFGSVVAVRTGEKLMALTFDDGPDPETTPAVLDALARHGMRATFFVVGERAERHPDLVARIRAEGHETGSHSWNHPSLPELPPRAAAEQIARTRAILGPRDAGFLRPPYGHQSLTTWRLARRAGYRVVMWTIAPGDWRGEDGGTLAAPARYALFP